MRPPVRLVSLSSARRAARLAVDHVARVRRVVLPAARVRRLLVDRGGDPLVEEHLAGMDRVAADVHLHVDVRRPAPVPAGEDRQELGLAGRVRPLVPAQEARRGAVDGRVVAERVAMPDLDVRLRDRPARLRVQHREADHEREPGLALGDVAPRQRSPTQYGPSVASGVRRQVVARLRVLAEELEGAGAEDRREPGPAGGHECIASGQLVLHGGVPFWRAEVSPTVGRRAVSRLRASCGAGV